jgi:hypothetical protein
LDVGLGLSGRLPLLSGLDEVSSSLGFDGEDGLGAFR